MFLIERLCGICSFIRPMLLPGDRKPDYLQVPDRARSLRTIWAELACLHSHHLCTALADALGFEACSCR